MSNRGTHLARGWKQDGSEKQQVNSPGKGMAAGCQCKPAGVHTWQGDGSVNKKGCSPGKVMAAGWHCKPAGVLTWQGDGSGMAMYLTGWGSCGSAAAL